MSYVTLSHSAIFSFLQCSWWEWHIDWIGTGLADHFLWMDIYFQFNN